MRILPLVLVGGAVAAFIATRKRRVARRRVRREARHLEMHKGAGGATNV
jgi:hypothetical protein